jgi:hypothetical protein
LDKGWRLNIPSHWVPVGLWKRISFAEACIRICTHDHLLFPQFLIHFLVVVIVENYDRQMSAADQIPFIIFSWRLRKRRCVPRKIRNGLKRCLLFGFCDIFHQQVDAAQLIVRVTFRTLMWDSPWSHLNFPWMLYGLYLNEKRDKVPEPNKKMIMSESSCLRHVPFFSSNLYRLFSCYSMTLIIPTDKDIPRFPSL